MRRVLTQTGLAPSSLMLELTESVLLRGDDERLHADLAELKSIGVKLAIDDFGTGYSSLSYLRELPIDVLKIDKSFVDGIAISEQRLALVEGIIGIARTLRLDVIAEGVVAAAREVSLGVPLVVRLEGTNVDLGKEILAKSGLPIVSADNLADAAEKVVRAVKEAA